MNFDRPAVENNEEILNAAEEEKKMQIELSDVANHLGEVMLDIRKSRPDLLTGIDLDRFDKVRDLMHSKIGGTEKDYSTRELLDISDSINALSEKLLRVRVSEPSLMSGIGLDEFDKIKSFINLPGKIRTSLEKDNK